MTDRAAVGLIIDNSGRLLFAKRSPSVKTFPDQWEFPGGALEGNENYEDALKRELYEELGVTLDEKPQPLRTSRSRDDQGKEWLVRSFVCRHRGEQPYPREPEKCSQVAFCNPDSPPAPLIDAAQSDLCDYVEKASRYGNH